MTNFYFSSPNLGFPLPEPMTAIDPGSWAHDSVTRRWPEIAKRIFEENDLEPTIKKRLEALISDIPNKSIRPINDPSAPDTRVWNQDIDIHLGKNWLEPPWFFTEHYFYRRIIEAVGYFQVEEGFDPFSYQKNQGLAVSRKMIRELAALQAGWKESDIDRDTINRLLYFDLWGNQADLSMWPAEGGSKPDHDDLSQANRFLLEDRTTEVSDYIIETLEKHRSKNRLRIDFLIDNAGFELVNDLVLAEYLLSTGVAARICFHVKPHPTFVSDATVKDVADTLAFFKMDPDLFVNELGLRLENFFVQDRLQIQPNFFWTSPLPGWDMPHPLKKDLAKSGLVISKGDANYRRLLGDLKWPATTQFANILAYFPAPIVALRTAKAEIISGLQAGQAERLSSEDPDWMINGRWGMVQFSCASA